MTTVNPKMPGASAGVAFSTLWVAKLIPLFDGLGLANPGRWTRALDRMACQGRVGDRAALLMFLSEEVLPELARKELPLAVRAWDEAATEEAAQVPDDHPRSRRRNPAGPVPGVVRAAAEARRMDAPREAFLAALLYDRVARLVTCASGMLRLSHAACREVIESSLARAPDLVDAALRLPRGTLGA